MLKYINHVKIIFILLCLGMNLTGSDLDQSLNQSDIDSILLRTKKNYKQLNNIKCQGTVSVDIPNFRIPDTKVTFFYQHPHNFKHYASEFTILPKSQYMLDIVNNITELNYSQKKEVDNKSEIIRLQVNSDFLKDTALIHINRQRNLITKIKFQKEKTFFNINIKYEKDQEQYLPDLIKYNFRLSQGIPKFSPPSIQRPFGETKLFNKLEDKKLKGSLKIKISNYQINYPHIDTVFQSDSIK